MTLYSDDGTPLAVAGVQGRRNLYMGRINSVGGVVWCANVSTDPGLSGDFLTLSGIDLAVVGDRVVLYGKVFNIVPSFPPSLGIVRCYDGAGGLISSDFVTSSSTLLCLFSVIGSTGLSGKVAIIRPTTGGNIIDGINLSESGAATINAQSASLVITDSNGGVTPYPLQGTGTSTAVVLQFGGNLQFQWATRVVGGGSSSVITTHPVSSGFATRYQRGIVSSGGNYAYTGRYFSNTSGIRFVDGNGGSTQTLTSTIGGLFMGYSVSLAGGIHGAAAQATGSAGVALLTLCSCVDPSSSDVYHLVQSLEANGGTVSFFNADGTLAESFILSNNSLTTVTHFMVKYSATGVYQWGRRITGIGNDQYYGTIFVSSRGCPIVYGPFRGATLQIYDGSGSVAGTLTNESGGLRFGYFAKWAADGEFVGVARLDQSTVNDANILGHAGISGSAFTLTYNVGSLTIEDMSGNVSFAIPSGGAGVDTMNLARWD